MALRLYITHDSNSQGFQEEPQELRPGRYHWLPKKTLSYPESSNFLRRMLHENEPSFSSSMRRKKLVGPGNEIAKKGEESEKATSPFVRTSSRTLFAKVLNSLDCGLFKDGLNFE